MADNIIFNSKVSAEGFTVNGTDINDLYATKKELEDIIATGGDGNTKYELTKSGSTITLTGSDGSSYSVTDTDTHVEVLDSTASTDATKAASANAVKVAYDTALDGKNMARVAQATADSKATTTYVDNAVASMVDSAPDTLNTLNELAAALGDDPNFATTVATQIGGKVSKSGDTMTGRLQVNAPIFGYNYSNGSQSAAAFVFDKRGDNFTGIGANGESDTIYFGAVLDADSGAWNSEYKQKWKFNGDIIANNIIGNHSYLSFTTSKNESGGYYKIKINSANQWMLRFNLNLYQDYRATSLQISGYNYVDRYWYSPAAVVLGDSDKSHINVYFGYDGINELWIGIPANRYAGITITDVTQGYDLVDFYQDLFSIIYEESLSGTIQSTVTANSPWYKDENVTAYSAIHDGNGNTITSTYLPLAGGGTITAPAYSDTPVYLQSGTGEQSYIGFTSNSASLLGYIGVANGKPVFYDSSPKEIIYSDNIGSQSVNYANSAGSVAWSNVSSRPTKLSQFTNDSGFITSASIPPVGNGTLTITQNGVSKGTFTANQSGNVTIALTDDNTTYSAATIYTAGLMSADDKTKLDNLATEGKCYTSEWANNVAWGSVYGRPTRLQDWPGIASAAYTADTAGECTGNSATASIAYNMREDPDTDDIEIKNTGDGYIYIHASSSNGFGGIVFSDGDGREVTLQDILNYCGI